MSDLSDLSILSQSGLQPGASTYFDERVLKAEIDRLYRDGPGYVGHTHWVPEAGDWRSLPWEDHGRLLVNNAGQVELLSNVCRHRQAIMLKGHGNSQNIVCPLHRWTYDLNGELLGAPHFNQQPCTRLQNYGLQNWRGLLFDSKSNIAAELAQVPFLDEIDFTGYQLDSVKVSTLPYNWKTFIEVYLEDYHVDPFHPGLGQFVDCANLQWHYGRNWSVQSVGIKAGLRRPGSRVYKQWHDAVMKFSDGKEPKYGAIWFCMYPNIMVEWYPHVLVVSTLHPKGPQETLNVVEFYYPEEIRLFEREFVEAEQAAYAETAVEDDEIATRMDEGRRVLMNRGETDAGPYQSPMEDGMVHFHTWYRQAMLHKESQPSLKLA
ncbi:MAG: aromatic ring-hydroxylating oxygenase subunit alpha [Limnobacter sp.]|uniref:aromatic ring-hydroxylating oxygenase subunit alpha n=1 Tax=Limnobacter sp. TaxID=2003368 RepID=UPI00391BC656